MANNQRNAYMKPQQAYYHNEVDKKTRLADFHKYQQEFYSQCNPELLDVDLEDVKDPQSASEYAQDCLKHMINTELKYQPTANCLINQKDITKRMRVILVDWLVEVHAKFKLLPETLFLTVNIIDRYCEVKQVQRGNYQLVGVTAMLIASKYEEIYAPEIRDFVYITDKAYTKEQILA